MPLGRARLHRRRRRAAGEEALTQAEAAAYAQRRLADGKSDAEVRLELLDQGLSPPEISAALLAAAPPRALRWSWLVVGAGTAGLALLLYLHQENFVVQEGHADWRPYAAFGAVGLALMARGLIVSQPKR